LEAKRQAVWELLLSQAQVCKLALLEKKSEVKKLEMEEYHNPYAA